MRVMHLALIFFLANLALVSGTSTEYHDYCVIGAGYV